MSCRFLSWSCGRWVAVPQINMTWEDCNQSDNRWNRQTLCSTLTLNHVISVESVDPTLRPNIRPTERYVLNEQGNVPSPSVGQQACSRQSSDLRVLSLYHPDSHLSLSLQGRCSSSAVSARLSEQRCCIITAVRARTELLWICTTPRHLSF